MKPLLSIVAGLLLLVAAWAEGWLQAALQAGGVVVYAIAACAALGLVCAALGRCGAVKVMENACVSLGLIGTVLGFILALSHVDADAAADVSKVAEMIGGVIAGMGVALYTTLIGAMAALWLHVTAAVHE